MVLALIGSLTQWTQNFHIVHRCSNGAALLEALAAFPTDLAIVDYAMSRGDNPLDGFMLLRKLRDTMPGVRCVMFTAQTNPSVFASAIRLGVAGIVSKEDEVSEIVRACQFVRAGGTRYFSPAVRAIVEQAGATAYENQPELTQKELEVVRLFVSGHSLASIAKQLGRSVSTVSTQKYMAMQKLQADSNTCLIRYAYETGLI
ncbi:signal transduction response regulator [Burkholderia cepacia GG4]|uniref:Signal transduction response regulator n=2 Tax=Burkholderia cepacia TaxID=292 RepID=A0A9W3JW59_BURCE|nr:signal transduction response regulator [Burkholderia cepacia GG4]